MPKKYFILLSVFFFLVVFIVTFQIYRQKQLKNNQTQAFDTTILNLNINPGTLNQTVESDSTTAAEIYLSAVDIFSAPPAGGISTGQLTTTVKDHRGTAVGWSQTASCTNFTSGTNTIAVTNLTLNPQTIIPIGGSDLTGVNLGTPHTFTGPADITTIFQATSSHGSGRYQSESNLNLLVPKTTVVGQYTATMTITVI
ncbi:MAG: WxL domain-containing protein [Patescibacteria group bacterium]